MSRTVKVDGMEVKTKVSGNLLISETNASDANYGSNLVQVHKALLEPVSSSTAVDETFWYTVDAKADGSKLHGTSGSGAVPYKSYSEGSGSETAIDGTSSGKTNYDKTFNQTYEISPSGSAYGTAYGYIDYDFYLKATSDNSKAQYINLTSCNLTYKDKAISSSGTQGVDLDRAWRIAVFAKNTSMATTGVKVTGDSGNLKSILSLAGAEYFDNGAVTTATGGYAAASSLNSAVNIGTVAAGATAYYKVTVRLWLEGQDKTCNSETYAALTDESWKLDLQFELEDSTGGVTNIGTADRTGDLTNDVPDATRITR